MSYHCSSSKLLVSLKSLKQGYTEILTEIVMKPLTLFIPTTYLYEKEFSIHTIKNRIKYTRFSIKETTSSLITLNIFN